MTQVPQMNTLENDENSLAPQAEATAGGRAARGGLRPLPDDAMVILPVRDFVLFPGVVLPVTIGRERPRAAAQEAARQQKPVGVLLQRDASMEEPGAEDVHWVGTSANIVRYITARDGAHHVIAQGEGRFRVLQFLEGWPFLVARVQRVEDPAAVDAETEARAMSLKQRAAEIIKLLPAENAAGEEVTAAMEAITSPSRLADFVAGLSDVSAAEKQVLLETFDLRTRLDKLLDLLARRVEVLKISRQIDEKTKESIEGQARERLLREQLRAIQKELGEGEEAAAEDAAGLEKAIAEAGMPEEVEKQARKELARLQRTPEAGGEHAMIRTYLEWLTELPWKVDTEKAVAAIDIAAARTVLDDDHFGLEKIKQRILEYLAVRKLNPGGKSPILCFAGPPGVGKTSLGQSIAKATNRKFVRVSLGGVHDEAEIRGHRRTYIGSLPGNIIQALRKAGEADCVMLLDEVDKVGAGHGDPAAALLEVLDPEQNATFRDNYLAVPYDLSRVLFICTANMLDAIPVALRDRMEVIELAGYTEQEKLQIARRYLLPRQLAAAGLGDTQVEVTDAALASLVRDYTREAGVRSLEREIGALLRSIAVKAAEGATDKAVIDAAEVTRIRGAHRYESEAAMHTGVPGIVTGLAWTPVGGAILFIEAARTPGHGKLILTGQLGDVMKESVQAALSLVKGRAAALGVDAQVLDKSDIHVHVPAGATPKDGPSAGVAMFTALASLLTGQPVSGQVAMTGEISLRGLVLPVGGIKEKLLAALRAGNTTVILPKRNMKDLEDVPAEVKDKLKLVWAERIEDVLAVALPDIELRPSHGAAATTSVDSGQAELALA